MGRVNVERSVRDRSTLAGTAEVPVRCRCGKRLALTAPRGVDDVELVMLVRWRLGDSYEAPGWLSVRCPRCRYTWQGRTWQLRALLDTALERGWPVSIDRAGPHLPHPGGGGSHSTHRAR